jgi:hypothetical protein
MNRGHRLSMWSLICSRGYIACVTMGVAAPLNTLMFFGFISLIGEMFSISQIRFASTAFTKLPPVALLSIKACMTI